MAEGEEGFVEVMLNAKEAVMRLQARLVWITKKRIERTLLNQDAVAFQPNTLEASVQSPVNLSSQGHLSDLKVSLPKLQLLIFNGDIQQWPEFWDMFNSAVHEQTVSPVAKASYLKGVLKGSAVAAISGIPVTTENYELAIKLLKEKFGKKRLL